MITKLNFKLKNQMIDFILGEMEEDNIRMLGESFRNAIFGSETLMLQEFRREIVGLHTEKKSAGTSLFREKNDWVFNVALADMDLMEANEMLSILQPLEGGLKNFCKVLKVSLYYLKEENGSKKNSYNAFLNDISITPPQTLVNDGNDQRLFQIKTEKDHTVYAFKSLNEGPNSLAYCSELLQYERINTEEIFLPSMHRWLGSFKNISRVTIQDSQKKSSSTSKKKYIN